MPVGAMGHAEVWDLRGEPVDNQDWLASMVGALFKLAVDVDSGAERVRSAYLHGAGAVQELFVEALLAHGALPGRLRTWTNVLVPKDGAVVGEAELDVLMLHERGVFVFESKNYSGWIFGSEGQRQWTQSLNRATKMRFYNPLMQNAAHVRALSRRLVVPEESFVSYVVFADRCELKEVPMRGEGWRVCRDDDLLRLVRADLAAREVAFNGLQFSTIEQRIDSLAAASTSGARESHARDVREASSGSVCPWCGRQLVERDGKYGRFLGCSSFPRCRYTRGG